MGGVAGIVVVGALVMLVPGRACCCNASSEAADAVRVVAVEKDIAEGATAEEEEEEDPVVAVDVADEAAPLSTTETGPGRPAGARAPRAMRAADDEAAGEACVEERDSVV